MLCIQCGREIVRIMKMFKIKMFCFSLLIVILSCIKEISSGNSIYCHRNLFQYCHTILIAIIANFQSICSILLLVSDRNVDLGENSKQYEHRTANLTDRQYAVLPLIVAILVGVASLIWITMVSVLPGAWIFPFVSRAFPSVVSTFSTIINGIQWQVIFTGIRRGFCDQITQA